MKVQHLAAEDQRGILITWSARAREAVLSLIGLAVRMGLFLLIYRVISSILHRAFY